MADTDDRTDAELPAAELAEAIDACCHQDRRLDMYHRFASPTARKFVELGFYSNYFGERTDPALYKRCRDAIAPTLTENDIRYLLRFESDASTKAYLNELMARLHAPKPQATQEPPSAPNATKATPKPRFPVKRKKARKRLARRWSAGRDSSGGLFGPKVLALLAVVSLVLVIGGIRAYLNDLRETEANQLQPVTDDDFPPQPVARTMPSESRQPALSRPKQVAITATDAPAVATAEPIAAQTSEEPSPTNDTSTVVDTPKGNRKFALSDGSRIRTRPDGTIEVPRTFSYSGAGLKKPFWIYDPQLEKSGRIEHEAQAEQKARAKWKALYDEAVRLGATATSRGSRP